MRRGDYDGAPAAEWLDPSALELVFDLTDGECHRLFSGVCSLDKEFSRHGNIGRGDAQKTYCQKLYKSLLAEGQFEPADLIRCKSCLKIFFNDGRHRACIALRKSLPLWTWITDDDYICEFCNSKDGETHSNSA